MQERGQNEARNDGTMLGTFKPHLAIPIVAVVAMLIGGLVLFWSGDSEEGETPALPSPPAAGTPNP